MRARPSPDGKRFAVHRHEGVGGDNWFFDLAQGRMQRLTFDTTQDNSSPVWSPDGARVAFASQRNNKWGLYLKLADGTASDELITESDTPKAPISWSPDGKLLVYQQATGGGDIWAVAVTGDKKPFPLLQTPFAEQFSQVSEDGKWLAYQSNETGRTEIYVKPFPEGPGKWQVSVDGGTFPRWRRDGKELFFYFTNNLFAADIRVAGASLDPGVPRPLFGFQAQALPRITVLQPLCVSADGQRFLLQPGGGGPSIIGGLADTIATVVDRGGIGQCDAQRRHRGSQLDADASKEIMAQGSGFGLRDGFDDGFRDTVRDSDSTARRCCARYGCATDLRGKRRDSG